MNTEQKNKIIDKFWPRFEGKTTRRERIALLDEALTSYASSVLEEKRREVEKILMMAHPLGWDVIEKVLSLF